MEKHLHVSASLLWNVVKSGRSLDRIYVKQTEQCRDCREFVWDFSREARSQGFSSADLLPSVEQQS
jgi:hypothetical protein